MARILVLYYSMYGHVETMANAIAEGARSVAGSEVAVKRVPETIPEEDAKRYGVKLDQAAPIASVEELPDYDAVIVGTPTRYGNAASQLRAFLDRTGGLWAKGALIGKVCSVFTSTATQHGGHETTITALHTTLLHHGMVIVGVPYSCKELSVLDEVCGGSPYGAGTIAGSDGKRMPSQNELAIARFQGAHTAGVTAALLAGRHAAQ